MKVNAGSVARHVFRLYLIKPSHYDDDGYVIQWLRSDIPSNTMATLNGIALECSAARVLGEMVFYPRYLWETIIRSVRLFTLFRRYKRILARVEATPEKHTYMDVALTPATK